MSLFVFRFNWDNGELLVFDARYPVFIHPLEFPSVTCLFSLLLDLRQWQTFSIWQTIFQIYLLKFVEVKYWIKLCRCTSPLRRSHGLTGLPITSTGQSPNHNLDQRPAPETTWTLKGAHYDCCLTKYYKSLVAVSLLTQSAMLLNQTSQAHKWSKVHLIQWLGNFVKYDCIYCHIVWESRLTKSILEL